MISPFLLIVTLHDHMLLLLFFFFTFIIWPGLHWHFTLCVFIIQCCFYVSAPLDLLTHSGRMVIPTYSEAPSRAHWFTSHSRYIHEKGEALVQIGKCLNPIGWPSCQSQHAANTLLQWPTNTDPWGSGQFRRKGGTGEHYLTLNGISALLMKHLLFSKRCFNLRTT